MNPTPESIAHKRKALQRWPRAIFSYDRDPRFSYCLYIPETYLSAPAEHRLVVAVHGSSRGVMGYRDALRAFAERERCVVLAPLFPVGPLGDGNADGYKFLIEGELRYDQVLLGMVAEIEAALDHPFGKFLLTGYSGGGQFAHRFFYLHPEHLVGVSIGAPGAVTRLDDDYDYWLGTRNWEQVFGQSLRLEALRQVPVQLVVGELDTVDLGFGGRAVTDEQIAKFGRSRRDRIDLLRENYEAAGLRVRLQIVEGVAHQGLLTTAAVEAFFSDILHKRLADGAPNAGA